MEKVKFIYFVGVVVYFALALMNGLVRKYYSKRNTVSLPYGIVIFAYLAATWPISILIAIFDKTIRSEIMLDFHFTKLFFQRK